MRALEGGFAEVARIDPRPPHAVGGRDGGRPRRRRLADPRLRRETARRCRARAAFYFDLASPLAYLAAERVLHVLPRSRRSGSRCSRASCPAAETFEAFRCREEEEIFRVGDRAPRAASSGCSRCAGRARSRSTARWRCASATYAKSIGRTVPFAQAAFRQAFAGRALARGARLRADRGRGLRDAPDGGAEGRRAALGRASSSTQPPRAAAQRRRQRRPRGAVGGASSASAGSIERGRACWSASRVTAGGRRHAAAMRANRAYRLIVTRGGLRAGAARGREPRRPHRGRGDRQRRGRAVLGPPPAGGLALARALRADLVAAARPRSSSRAGVPWRADDRRAASPARTQPEARAREWLATMTLIRRFEERAGEMYARAKIGGFLHLSIGEEATIVGARGRCARRTT